LSNFRNPWFTEFWELHFDCHFQPLITTGPEESNLHDTDNKTAENPAKGDYCSGNEILSKETGIHVIYRIKEMRSHPGFPLFAGYMQQLNLHFVYDTALAYAHALHQMQKEKCGENFFGLCPEMEPRALIGEEIMSYLRAVEFTSKCKI
jgi:hypothetical protein